jgi:hypothetical protein
MLPDTNDISRAPGEAFTASSMTFRKQMPTHEREEPNDWEFYFKHCSMNGNESYFSKTSYDCSGPFY